MNKYLTFFQNKPWALFMAYIIISCLLYSQVISSPPIWDDNYFIFDFSPFQSGISYSEIWKNFAWPMTTTIHKFTLDIFGRHYTLYHLLNTIIHGLNSFLLFKIIQKMKLPYPLVVSFFFLIHPANLISVAWMIQIKTLLAFTFFALSLICYLRFQDDKRVISLIIGIPLFVLSLLTKSTAILFPVALLFIHFLQKKMNLRLMLPIFLFTLLSLWGGIKLMGSPIVEKNQTVYAEPITQRIEFAIQTIWYYLEQAFFPSNFTPVKGILTSIDGFSLVALILFLICIIVLLFLVQRTLGVAMMVALILMTPFLGIIKAPYMIVTSVSDQHLYLILPILIWIFVCLGERIIFILTRLDSPKTKISGMIALCFFGSYFFSSTIVNSKIYQNEENFYQTSLKYNPGNLFFYINLTTYYQEQNNFEAAVETINSALNYCQEHPELKNTEMYSLIGTKWFEIEQIARRRKALERN